MCAGMDFAAEVVSFESKLQEHGYRVSKRATSRFVQVDTDNPNLRRLLAGGGPSDEGARAGGVRLIDYWIEGVPFPISLINTCEQFETISDVLSSFDLSCCCVACHIVEEESVFDDGEAGEGTSVMFGFTYGPDAEGPGGVRSTPRENLLTGQAVCYDPTHQNLPRLKKYESRGFAFGTVAAAEGEALQARRGAQEALLESYESAAHQALAETDHLDLRPSAQPGPDQRPPLSHVPGTGLSVVTWNIEGVRRDASNIDGVVEMVLARRATIVCLQEVTAEGFRALKEARTLREHGYSVYGIMDQDYVAEYEEASGRRAYGLAFVTQLALEVQSFAFEPSKDTYQNRRFDIAFLAGEFAIVNLHAESNTFTQDMGVSEQRRIRQFEIAAARLRAGMEERGILAGMLCGDLNTAAASEGEQFLLKHFTDLNIAGAVSTLTNDSGRAHKYIRYYDRILQLAPGRLSPQGNWSSTPTALSDHNCVSCELDFNYTKRWQQDASYRPAGAPAAMPIMTRSFSAAKRCFRVVLTGGPCSGKTSALAAIKSRFQRMGYQVMIVAEAATQVMDGCGGFDPAWAGTPRAMTFQKIIARATVSNEDQAEELSSLRDQPAIMLCDRGVLDGRAFCSAEIWSRVLADLGLTEQELFSRYDKVLHLESVAMYVRPLATTRAVSFFSLLTHSLLVYSSTLTPLLVATHQVSGRAVLRARRREQQPVPLPHARASCGELQDAGRGVLRLRRGEVQLHRQPRELPGQDRLRACAARGWHAAQELLQPSRAQVGRRDAPRLHSSGRGRGRGWWRWRC